jgi:hypothetical protein
LFTGVPSGSIDDTLETSVVRPCSLFEETILSR